MSVFISSFKTSSIARRDFLVCALLTAFLWNFAGRESGIFAFGWIALAPIFYALTFCDARTRRRSGYFVGWFCYALLNIWIFPTILRGGDAIAVAPPVAALLGVLAVALIGAIHGVQLYVVAWLFDAHSRLAQRAIWLLPLLIAALWTAFDILRTQGALAHAWGALGYTQWRDYALMQSAAFIGQHGITFLCVWCAASLALWARRGDKILWRAPFLVFVALHLFGAWQLRVVPENETQLRVLLVQTNASSEEKSRGGVDAAFLQALQLTQENARRADRFDLVVWPETTIEVRDFEAPPKFSDAKNAREYSHFDAKKIAEDIAPKNGAQLVDLFQSLAVVAVREKATYERGLVQFSAPPRAEDLDALPDGGAPNENESANENAIEREYSQSGDARFQALEPNAGGAQLRAVRDAARRLGTRILCGALLYARDGKLFNAAVLVDESGRVQVSAKERLVPFGERAPFGEILPFLRRFAPEREVETARSVTMVLPPRGTTFASTRSEFLRAEKNENRGENAASPALSKNASTRDPRFGALICFESCFPAPASRLKAEGARALFVLTNDQWFAGTGAPWQHAAMAAMRAAENGVAVAQAGNGGYSFCVDRHGRFVLKTSLDTARAVAVSVPLAAASR